MITKEELEQKFDDKKKEINEDILEDCEYYCNSVISLVYEALEDNNLNTMNKSKKLSKKINEKHNRYIITDRSNAYISNEELRIRLKYDNKKQIELFDGNVEYIDQINELLKDYNIEVSYEEDAIAGEVIIQIVYTRNAKKAKLTI